MHDEEVVEFDYIPYLLDNLSILNRNIKIELKTHNIQPFLDFLKDIFGDHNVDHLLGKIQTVKKSKLREEELDIRKTKRWNH